MLSLRHTSLALNQIIFQIDDHSKEPRMLLLSIFLNNMHLKEILNLNLIIFLPKWQPKKLIFPNVEKKETLDVCWLLKNK